PHQSGTGIFYVISGKGIMTVEGKEMEVRAGCMVFVDKGESRGIRATERLTAFAVHIG
ncbi:MAG: cupin domain-containing protein, partial [Deltaproteobacteria bacterium]|nr:cupin domain-containing protein [Deltaproteobacteria bacterium]